jgi:DNA-directed RNA polymerase specialized sigma24 family protein
MERQVIERCLQGDPAAWSLMYERFHDPLATSVRAFLGKAGHDRDLVEEVCARVWYALVRNHFELLARFDIQRGVQLVTFLTLLAKTQARLLLRSERRRRTREQVASKPEAHPPDATSWNVLEDDDFLTTLSPAEQTFFQRVLVAGLAHEAPLAVEPYSRQYAWQLRHRVRRKLEDFLQ